MTDPGRRVVLDDSEGEFSTVIVRTEILPIPQTDQEAFDQAAYDALADLEANRED